MRPTWHSPEPAIVERLLDDAAALLAGRRIAVLTGAGVSTDSGIPDYRGEGAPVRTPMTFTQFLGDTDYRKRYWAGSQLGWRRFDGAEPNAGHLALAALEADGVVNGVITQNVDGLHLQRRLAARRRPARRDGPRALPRPAARPTRAPTSPRGSTQPTRGSRPSRPRQLGPDGDVEVARRRRASWCPPAASAAAMLKPDIVFFGEFVPKEKFVEASALVQKADALLIAGSSLVVNSGIRLLDHATRRKLPVRDRQPREYQGRQRAQR